MLVNIYLLELLGTYRGWRHARGLPVRGQRSWSNAWSVYRSNLTLRAYKVSIAKRLYGQNYTNVYYIAYLAEEVNKMWKRQWDKEWVTAKKKRLMASKKNKKLINIDLPAMAKLQVSTSRKQVTKKKRQARKNYFTLGFDPDFTKILLQQSINDVTVKSPKKLKMKTKRKIRLKNK